MFKKIAFIIGISLSISSPSMNAGWGWKPLSDIDPKASQAISDIAKAISDVAKSLEATGVNVGGTLEASVKTLRKALDNAATTFSESGFKIVLDPKLDPKLVDSIQIISKDGAKVALAIDPALTKTIQTIADKGFQIIVDPEVNKNFKTIAEKGFQVIVDPELNKNFKTIADQGVKAQLGIDPTTIKTLCLTGVGACLAIAGILVLYYELTKPDVTVTQPESAQKTYFQQFVALLKNKYVIGSAQVLAGLLLIIKSNALIAKG
jgi:methionine synthase II (cobalamin-independent)